MKVRRRRGSEWYQPSACCSLAVFLWRGLILTRIRSSAGHRRGRRRINRALTPKGRRRKSFHSSFSHIYLQNVNRCMKMMLISKQPPGKLSLTFSVLMNLAFFLEKRGESKSCSSCANHMIARGAARTDLRTDRRCDGD